MGKKYYWRFNIEESRFGEMYGLSCSDVVNEENKEAWSRFISDKICGLMKDETLQDPEFLETLAKVEEEKRQREEWRIRDERLREKQWEERQRRKCMERPKITFIPKGLTVDYVVEDAAEGMGSRFDGKVLGTFGKYGVLSFNGNKMITTSGGGALICNGKASPEASPKSSPEGKDLQDGKTLPSGGGLEEASKLANEVMWYATQARDAYPYYQHTAIGYNYRMSNVCAGIGRGQMTVLNDHIAHHKHVQSLYEELLKDVAGVHIHKQPEDSRYDANFWLCAATLDKEVKIQGQENAYKEVIKTAVGGAAGVIHAVDSATTDCQPNENVEALRVFMLGKKIECRPVWKPMHKQPVYEGAPVYTNGIEEELFKVGFCLPAGPYVTDDDVKYIVESIKEAIVR